MLECWDAGMVGPGNACWWLSVLDVVGIQDLGGGGADLAEREDTVECVTCQRLGEVWRTEGGREGKRRGRQETKSRRGQGQVRVRVRMQNGAVQWQQALDRVPLTSPVPGLGGAAEHNLNVRAPAALCSQAGRLVQEKT